MNTNVEINWNHYEQQQLCLFKSEKMINNNVQWGNLTQLLKFQNVTSRMEKIVCIHAVNIV